MRHFLDKNEATLDKVSYESGQKYSKELKNHSFTSVETEKYYVYSVLLLIVKYHTFNQRNPCRCCPFFSIFFSFPSPCKEF